MNNTYTGIEYRYMTIRHNAEMIAREFEKINPDLYTAHGKIPVLRKIFGYTRMVFVWDYIKNADGVIVGKKPVIDENTGKQKRFIAEKFDGILTGFNSRDTVLSVAEREQLLLHAENVIRQQSKILAKKRAKIAK